MSGSYQVKNQPPMHIRHIGYNEPQSKCYFTNHNGFITVSSDEWHTLSIKVQDFIREYNGYVRKGKDPSVVPVPDDKVIRPRPRNAGLFKQVRRVQRESEGISDRSSNYNTNCDYVNSYTNCKDIETGKDVEVNKMISEKQEENVRVNGKKSVTLDLSPDANPNQE